MKEQVNQWRKEEVAAMLLDQRSLLNTSTTKGSVAGLVQNYDFFFFFLNNTVTYHLTVIECSIAFVFCMFIGGVVTLSCRGSMIN